MPTHRALSSLFAAVALSSGCGNPPIATAPSESASASAAPVPPPVASAAPMLPTAAAGVAGGETFKPVPLPDLHIPGYAFPEPEATIVGWTEKNDQKAITKHAWGIWASLTAPSGEKFEGQELHVFETWLTPQDLLTSKTALEAATTKRRPRPLGQLHQIEHTRRLLKAAGAHGEATVTGFVKYDPTAAAHIVDDHLFSATYLKSLAGKQPSVPTFPTTSVSIKPVFQTLGSGAAFGGGTSVKVGGRYFQNPQWPGSPDPAKPFGPGDWKQCIWIDVQDLSDGPGTGKVDTTCAADGSSRKPETTYGLGRFIQFQLDAVEAAEINAANKAAFTKSPEGNAYVEVAKGDYSVLLAMHVTSRETTRWTWQTYWWTQNPEDPGLPSSKTIAAARPAELKGAARSYAHCSAYSMETPPQPNTGGKNAGESVYCFNPWLEAGFDKSILPLSKDGIYKKKPVKNDVGSQTNCMSCHAFANFSPEAVSDSSKFYTGDRYVDLDDPTFKGTVKVDFLWSIPSNAK